MNLIMNFGKKSFYTWLESPSTSLNIKIPYVLFSIFVVLYAAFSLTIFKLQIFPTINRITYFDAAVRWTITDSLQYDIIFASIICSAAILMTYKKHFLYQ